MESIVYTNRLAEGLVIKVDGTYYIGTKSGIDKVIPIQHEQTKKLKEAN